MMLPRSSSRPSLSKMSFGGLGGAMMKGRMHSKGIDRLEGMIDDGLPDVHGYHGVKREELMPGIEIGGVASYLDAADSANVNLFI